MSKFNEEKEQSLYQSYAKSVPLKLNSDSKNFDN